MANRLALRLGLITIKEEERIKNLLKRYNLPTEYQIDNIDSFYKKFFLDKKSSNNKIKFILPAGIGGFKILDNIDENLVKDILIEYKEVKT